MKCAHKYWIVCADFQGRVIVWNHPLSSLVLFSHRIQWKLQREKTGIELCRVRVVRKIRYLKWNVLVFTIQRMWNCGKLCERTFNVGIHTPCRKSTHFWLVPKQFCNGCQWESSVGIFFPKTAVIKLFTDQSEVSAFPRGDTRLLRLLLCSLFSRGAKFTGQENFYIFTIEFYTGQIFAFCAWKLIDIKINILILALDSFFVYTSMCILWCTWLKLNQISFYFEKLTILMFSDLSY